MLISRRNALGLALVDGATSLGAHTARGQDLAAPPPPVPPPPVETPPSEILVDAFPPLPTGWDDAAADFNPTNIDVEQLGSSPPMDEEVAMAAKILSLAPYGQNKPFEVAQFFQRVGQGEFNTTLGADVRHYVRGWPVRYNPVLVNFFKATNTNPLAFDYDYTAWCAAFVNWCIARSYSQTQTVVLNAKGLMAPFDTNALRGTHSASSGSFRCWATATPIEEAQKGDVIVWATDGTVDACKPGQGHVGFFAGMGGDGRFRTLGGNQKDPASQQYAVVEKLIGQSFNRSDGKVTFQSIRRLA